MSELLQHRWVKKTRKPHRCDWCSLKIEAGSAARYTAAHDGGDFFAGYMHPECAAALDSLPTDDAVFDDGIGLGDFARGSVKEHGKANPAFSPDYRGDTGAWAAGG